MASYRRIRRFSLPAIVLHWLVAVGIFTLFVHGFAMMRIDEADRMRTLNLHRSVGVLVFALVLVRIVWRITHPPPAFHMPRLQELVADYVHMLIYALLVANGCAGTLGWLASGDPIAFFGMELRASTLRHVEATRVCLAVGNMTAHVLLAVIVLHAAAAIKHHLIDRDRLLERMWPGRTILVTILEAMPVRRRRHSDRPVVRAHEVARAAAARGRAAPARPATTSAQRAASRARRGAREAALLQMALRTR